ncbi:MAG: hypothetical protein A2Y04_06420 [Omnitrophica WOR_2 bacterium GWC2_45_7]|nr:MAG: hypothetical protein A2Y04_06420 [Omnitrophica WOR_2 bacterium GWC2_45_7]
MAEQLKEEDIMQREKVLVVEDDAVALKVLVKFLTKEGFDVVEASDAKVGLEKIDAEKPSIVITDLNMPYGDGFQIIRHAKKVVPYSQAILVTAFGNIDTAIMALREGVLDYLKKPIDLNELVEVLAVAKDRIREGKETNFSPVLLIVEDDTETRDILGRVMEKENWEILKAKDGQEAISLFKEHKVDLLILDVKMPGKDGLTVFHELRVLSKDFEAIMVSGYGEEEMVLKALEAGAINFLRKPIDLNQMHLFLQKALDALNLKRALKYRSFEFDMVSDIMKCFIGDRELIMGFPVPSNTSLSDAGRRFLDLVPAGIVLVNKAMDVLYANKSVTSTVTGEMKKLDEPLLKGLEKIRILGLAYGQLKSVIEEAFKRKEGMTETIKIGEWAYIVLVKLILIEGEKREEAVLLVIRGERS